MTRGSLQLATALVATAGFATGMLVQATRQSGDAPMRPNSEASYSAAIRSHEAAIMALKVGREADRIEGKLLPLVTPE